MINNSCCKVMVVSNNHTDNLMFVIDGKPIPRVYSLDLFGIVIEISVCFSEYISKIVKKVGKQIDVLSRFKNILSSSTKMCLYESFISPHFSYCSSVWNNFLKVDSKKFEKLNERVLRYLQ